MNRFTETIERIQDWLDGVDIGPEQVDLLLAPGRIESLVSENRAPIHIGNIGVAGEPLKPYYQIPPKGFDPGTYKVEMSMGILIFYDRLHRQKHGSTFTLTNEQAAVVEERKAAAFAALKSN